MEHIILLLLTRCMAHLTRTGFCVNRYCSMADFRHFGFLKFGNFNFWSHSEAQYASPYGGALKRFELRLRARFCRNRSNPGWDMAIFRFFKLAAVRHLGFSKVGNFNFWSHSEAQYASPYQISRRSVKLFRRYGRFSIFQAAAILDFGNFKFLTAGTLKRVELRLRAKFCRNRSNRGWDMAICQFFEMAALRHLGFSNVGYFNLRSHSEAQYASSYKFR